MLSQERPFWVQGGCHQLLGCQELEKPLQTSWSAPSLLLSEKTLIPIPHLLTVLVWKLILPGHDLETKNSAESPDSAF